MTSIEQVATLATFGAVWAVLSVGHNLAAHVIRQTDQQAEGRREPAAGLGCVPGTRSFCWRRTEASADWLTFALVSSLVLTAVVCDRCR
ncbi:hypothetical protein [Streptomyces sp. G-G2]|uniref:hypothetical protein n=1 Tax=Streptomyces sp. G-G2 TaxID=3046201 RepID=UPI0024BB7085|nr:hypothetical protein [Streptomyces sp. G-G2]MDJ0384534.1 hypothetical protein [Streptomyces sp. G-G2]